MRKWQCGLCNAPNRPPTADEIRQFVFGSDPRVQPGGRGVRRQTQRALLIGVGQVGLLTVGVELAAACDRLPGQAKRVPRIGWVANQAPAGVATAKSTTEALVAGLGDYRYLSGQNLQLESRFPPKIPTILT